MKAEKCACPLTAEADRERIRVSELKGTGTSIAEWSTSTSAGIGNTLNSRLKQSRTCWQWTIQ